jgi:hypothetical protein
MLNDIVMSVILIALMAARPLERASAMEAANRDPTCITQTQIAATSPRVPRSHVPITAVPDAKRPEVEGAISVTTDMDMLTHRQRDVDLVIRTVLVDARLREQISVMEIVNQDSKEMLTQKNAFLLPAHPALRRWFVPISAAVDALQPDHAIDATTDTD